MAMHPHAPELEIYPADGHVVFRPSGAEERIVFSPEGADQVADRLRAAAKAAREQLAPRSGVTGPARPSAATETDPPHQDTR